MNVYVRISNRRQYTEGADHKSALRMCFTARRLQLKGNVRVSDVPVSEKIAELIVMRETGRYEGNVLKIWGECVLAVHFKAEDFGYLNTYPKARVNVRAKCPLTHYILS